MLELLLVGIYIIVIGVIIIFPLNLQHKFCECCKDINQNYNLNGKTVIVTGANSGIGFYAAKELAKLGARVILACRDMVKATAARNRILEEHQSATIIVKRLDLSSLQSVRNFCEEIQLQEESIDVLINNAGAIQLGDHMTQDGLQITWQVNYFSPFLLTVLLLDRVRKSKGTIVNVTGSFYTTRASLDDLNCYHSSNHVMIADLIAYFNAKSALYEFSLELERILKHEKSTVFVFAANLNSSNFWRRIIMGVHATVYFWLHLVFSKPEDEAMKLIKLLTNKVNVNYNNNDDYLSNELWSKTMSYVMP